ncbi:hypothetical protein Tco_1517961 [Tanacetum coccineum]
MMKTLLFRVDLDFRKKPLFLVAVVLQEVESSKVREAAEKLGCLILRTPFTYLGTKVGDNMNRVLAWQEVIDKNSNQANWVKWDTVMSAKETGGLGVASFHALNRGLMFKWLWKFFVDKDSLWTRVIKAIHGDDGKLDKEVNICSRSSWLSIVKEAKVLKNKGVDFFEYLKLVVGDGRTIRFWKDKWYHAGILKDLFPRVFALETQKDVTIYDKLEAPSLEHTFRRSVRGGVEQTQFDAVILAADTINLVPQYDRYKWTLSNDGEYSVASFRKKVDCCRSSSDATRTRWVNFIPIKVNIVAWKIKLNALPTRFNLSCRGIDIESLTYPTCEGGQLDSKPIAVVCLLWSFALKERKQILFRIITSVWSRLPIDIVICIGIRIGVGNGDVIVLTNPTIYTSALQIADVIGSGYTFALQIANVFGFGYTSALQIANVFGPGYTFALHIANVFGSGYTSALQIVDVFGSALVCMHLFGLLRIETSSSTESALWDAPLYVCFSVFVYFMFGKLLMFTAAAL